VLDVRRPEKMMDTLVTIPTIDMPNAVFADGEFLFVADHREGLVIIKKTEAPPAVSTPAR